MASSLLVPLVAVLAAAAASCGVLLLGASAAASRAPAIYLVGDASGWAVPPANATDALNKWAIRHRFHVGDVLAFKYSNNDSVLLVRRGDYDACNAASPVQARSGTAGAGASVVLLFRLDRPGLFFFISGEPGRCEAGQRMVVHVADSSLGGAPAPAPGGTDDDDEPSRSPSGDRPIPVAFRLFVAAGLGFLGGCFLAALIIWLIVNCRR
ncbi:unnamed protein product [Urochloa decumbens]|uniref:Phytocyanin domain-containing protein n=1 Tax=Urochloa decumbens TaxID=240449 RepID=A0ABC9FTK2_9POAL